MSPLKEIRDRRAALSKKLASLEAEMEALRADDVKLANAEEVLVSIGGIEEPAERSKRLVKKLKGRPRQKPAGIPSMPDMIFAALQDAEKRGLKGLEPKEIRDFINGKWWPDVPLNAVGPIVWRLATKDDKLNKEGDIYSLPKMGNVATPTNHAAQAVLQEALAAHHREPPKVEDLL